MTKKTIPGIKLIPDVRHNIITAINIFLCWAKAIGNIGYGAKHSQTTKSRIRKSPIVKVAITWEELHGYIWPPQLRPTKKTTTPDVDRKPPR